MTQRHRIPTQRRNAELTSNGKLVIVIFVILIFLIVIFGSISMVVILVHDNYSAALQPCRSMASGGVLRKI